MPTFSDLLTDYMRRTGISDSELARSIGVQRQTIFRWKEGATARPRVREDVLRCAARLRLTPEERDLLLVSAGFAPESAPVTPSPASYPADIVVLAPPDNAPEAAAAPTGPGAQSVRMAAMSEESSAELDQPPAWTADGRRRVVHRPGWRWLLVAAFGIALIALPTTILLRNLSQPPAATPTPITVILNAPSVGVDAAQRLPIAIGGETLLLVAPFANYTPDQGYNMAGRIREALRDVVGDAALEETLIEIWPQAIANERQAAAALERSAGRLIIWGEFDSGRVQAMILATGDREPTVWERQLGSPDDLPTTINVDAPREIVLLAQSALGRLLNAEQKYDQAQAAFGRAIDLQPVERTTLANLYFYSGLAHERLTPPNWDRAIEAYSQTLTLQPEWTNTLYNRGRAHLMRSRLAPLHSADQARDLEGALADLSATIAARPSFWEAYLNRGSAYFERNQKGDLAKALADYDQAVGMADANYLTHLARALALIRTDDAAWRVDMERARKLAPDLPEVEQALCWGYLLDFAAEEALPHCQAAIALAEDADAYRDLSGLVYAQLGELGKAQADLSAYLAWVRRQPASQYERLYGDKLEPLIVALAAGQNPVTPDLIDSLRKGD